MFRFKKSSKVEKDYSTGLFVDILEEIKRLNNEKTPRRNNWKLRQTWINNYIDLTINNLLNK